MLLISKVEMAGVEPASEMHEPWALRAQLLIQILQ